MLAAGRSSTGHGCSTSGSTASAVNPRPLSSSVSSSRSRRQHRSCRVLEGSGGAGPPTPGQAQPADGGVGENQLQKRWEAQIREGRVQNLTCRDAAQLLADGWALLDVRPPTESCKAHIVGATEVPLFVPEDIVDLGSLLKQLTAFMMGGWWLGGAHMRPNGDFLAQVQAQLPNMSAPVLVGCQKGMRSLAACEVLARAGYGRLAWINGGFDSAAEHELPTQGDVDLRHAGIGGLSAALGLTEVQQEEAAGPGKRQPSVLLKLAGLLLLIDLLALAYESAVSGQAPPPGA